ncbi:DNA adenine methylase [Leptotrichia wadei]|uniref:Site-specific DNA-methyltransferase (adenine-specific) n=1 Tax=Leptotrichia wadei TaxID=157687 RepID=A0A510KCM7_9FUSO|nr:DNA adenine methylase [Leptotrichia wadei]BBM48481.1 DNA adenine methylase [Leptotrichia wadei]
MTIIKKGTVKPFLKWAGGKGQLIDEIEKFYPFDKKINKYAEPFIGGGAVLFDILNKYELEKIYISDVNKELVNCYVAIKENVHELIKKLRKIEDEFLAREKEDRKIYYYEKREKFNKLKLENNNEKINRAALMIFLNRTCFNGLYRVNKKGLFNVPMGDYKNPKICDEENLIKISKKLKNVEIIYGDYKKSYDFIDENTFVYFDPPYRPLNQTSSFTSYTEYIFGDKEQIELSEYFRILNKKGAKLLLSNSDPKNVDINDEFFDNLYKEFDIKRIEASRAINSKGEKRGKVTEVLISNIQLGAKVMNEIKLYNFNFSSRKEWRKSLILEFLKEEAGTGKGELASKYRYYVEILKNGEKIYLNRPATLNYGMDFTVHLENTQFRLQGPARDMPSHSNIIDDLKQKQLENFCEYEKVKKILNKLYNCEFVNEEEYSNIYFAIGIEIEGILKIVKWLFLEQDVTYWNYSGRAMLYQSLKDNGLV